MREKIKKYKVSLILILFLPILVNVLTLFIMNDKQLKEIPMGVYIGDNTSLTRTIVNSFDNNETFGLKYYASSPEEVEELMKEGKILYGLVIPKNFTKDLKDMKRPKLMTVIDGSQLSSASFTKIRSSEILLTIKTGAMISSFEGKFSMPSSVALNTARPIETNVRLLGNPTRNYVNFLLPGFMTALVQIGIAMTASVAFIAKKGKDMYKNLFENIAFYTIAGFVAMITIIFIQVRFFKVPLVANVPSIMLLTFVFSLSVTLVSQFISAVINNRVLASQVAAIWFIPSSILSGYTWPLSSMPQFYQKLAYYMPYTHYGETLRDLMLRGSSNTFNQDISVLAIISIVSFGLIVLFSSFGIEIKLKDKEEISYES
ncbi:ABC transporter permease [Helicovermis profundi]|uniref:ABC transporter permease n=1 Tax=Helicovermis profundi TaxID=3065157 RepID=A0AAU9EBT0_9FIRM|nr:ABC transporter permease [Clostridia bacterium S502]